MLLIKRGKVLKKRFPIFIFLYNFNVSLKRTFKEEYLEFLRDFKVDCNPDFLLDIFE